MGSTTWLPFWLKVVTEAEEGKELNVFKILNEKLRATSPQLRPRKDATAPLPDTKSSKSGLVNSQVGKRRVKLPKRFEETVHSLNLKEDVKADGDDFEETVEDAGEDFTVTIDLTESKASQSNPVIAEINSILNQFDHHQSDQRRKCAVGVTSDLACEVCDRTFVKEKELGESPSSHRLLSQGESKYLT